MSLRGSARVKLYFVANPFFVQKAKSNSTYAAYRLEWPTKGNLPFRTKLQRVCKDSTQLQITNPSFAPDSSLPVGTFRERNFCSRWWCFHYIPCKINMNMLGQGSKTTTHRNV